MLINAYSHAVILLHRPLLLCDIKTEDDRNAVQDSANACVEAALRILGLFGDSCEGGRMYGAFWVSFDLALLLFPQLPSCVTDVYHS